jgi:hypothetical protein
VNRSTWLIVVLTLFFSLAGQAGTTRNGFDVGNASIPVAEILSGGPPRDGIPAIDEPHFVGAGQADFLAPDDRVIGISRNGEARAYPIAIMNWHEIVNDEIGGESIVVTYCPLCGTGMVFLAPPGLDYGVSGLLYNSDVLLYDRQSQSLWSQIRMQAVSGKRVGENLQLLPASHTSWRDWSSRFPRTRVLSTQTGVSRDYTRDPYAGYARSRKLYFPVSSRDQRYHPKEQVIGVAKDGAAKAWPFAELAKSDGEITDTLAGTEVTVRYNSEARSGAVYDQQGKEIPSVIAFWFAWMSFHPEAEVYKAN